MADATVMLAGHVYLEKGADAEGRCDISIRRDACDGTVVGSTFWRSTINSEATLVANTVSLTGYDTIDGATTYVLCVDVFVGPDVTLNMRGLNATWSPAE